MFRFSMQFSSSMWDHFFVKWHTPQQSSWISLFLCRHLIPGTYTLQVKSLEQCDRFLVLLLPSNPLHVIVISTFISDMHERHLVRGDMSKTLYMSILTWFGNTCRSSIRGLFLVVAFSLILHNTHFNHSVQRFLFLRFHTENCLLDKRSIHRYAWQGNQDVN